MVPRTSLFVVTTSSTLVFVVRIIAILMVQMGMVLIVMVRMVVRFQGIPTTGRYYCIVGFG